MRDRECPYILQSIHKIDVRDNTDTVLSLESALSSSQFSKSETGKLVGALSLGGLD